MKVYGLLNILLDLLMGLGLVIMVSPVFVFWLIRDYDRYIWIIRGPFPFSHFGSGPFLVFMSLVLFLIGISTIIVSISIKVKLKK